MNSSDVETLKKKTEDVRQALYKLSSAAYQSGATQQQYADQNAAGSESTSDNTSSSNTNSKADDDGTIDAEYTEVKKDKK